MVGERGVCFCDLLVLGILCFYKMFSVFVLEGFVVFVVEKEGLVWNWGKVKFFRFLGWIWFRFVWV